MSSSHDEFVSKKMCAIPKFNECECFMKCNYTIPQMKEIAKFYKLKLSGNKCEIKSRIYNFLYLSKSAVLVQKLIRGVLIRKYNKLHGPAYINRGLCTNSYDFLSMDELTDIPKEQFFSFKDDDGFVYGFDIISLYNLIYKNNGSFKNPYTNKPITVETLNDFRTLLRLGNILKINVVTKIEDVTTQLTNEKKTELRVVSLFQKIDALGNYSKVSWFMSLSVRRLNKFIYNLQKIWHRSNIPKKTKKAICPPNGDPFSTLPNVDLLVNNADINYVRNVILDCLEKMVTNGINNENKSLGALYILSTMTLVKSEVAHALPWLYESIQLLVCREE